ncbi:hypothetical protein F4001_09610 [Candidatus Poribacteria bacterium]|nr:hypothetical protein [Candidatus Poribacteria bacterium]
MYFSAATDGMVASHKLDLPYVNFSTERIKPQHYRLFEMKRKTAQAKSLCYNSFNPSFINTSSNVLSAFSRMMQASVKSARISFTGWCSTASPYQVIVWEDFFF